MESLARRCSATVKTAGPRFGQPCGRPPIRGGDKCMVHGGGSPQAREAANHRLLSMVEPAFDVLARALQSAPPCEHCGRSDADRDPVAINAAKIILDRAGFGPSANLKVTHDQEDDDVSEMSTQELLARAELIVARMRTQGAIEAEVISSGDAGLNPVQIPENAGSHPAGDQTVVDSPRADSPDADHGANHE